MKTSKTGEKVDIPLFPLLREELERIKATAAGSVYCFPKGAEMYQSNPDGISVRVKQVLARAFEQNDVAEGELESSGATPADMNPKSRRPTSLTSIQ